MSDRFFKKKIDSSNEKDQLIQNLKNKHIHIRAEAAKTLEKLGWKPEDDMEKVYYLLAKEQWGELAKLKEKAVEPLIQALKDEDKGVRREAASTLGRIGDAKAVEALILALKDRDRNVRREAEWALGEIGDKRALDALIQALKDEDRTVRLGAAWDLGRMGDPKAVEALI